ncbi:Myosin heavy chain-related isoform 1 [Tripterygium wilfordii]|uniref:Myosin heavy chain-related isoform 1 n=1 Tax=Tripterygium wilfordii TaxID=458696 RepID=A0A7J7DAV2_TRIWF|nr:Myosin heavy chain-related isoform 1 [Tripterygium wilfordii]
MGFSHVTSSDIKLFFSPAGDKQVLFADKLLKFTGTGKIKQRILLITNVAVYILDPETDILRRQIALVAVEKMCLSELSDNFFAIIIPTEYDLLMASPRKTEIVTILGEATKSSSNYELEMVFSNSFQYNAAAEMVKEVQFEEVEGGVRTRIVRK